MTRPAWAARCLEERQPHRRVAPFSRRSLRGGASASFTELPLPASFSLEAPCGVSREWDARCVGPTSAVSRFVRVPALRRFPMRHARGPAHSGSSPASRRANSLHWQLRRFPSGAGAYAPGAPDGQPRSRPRGRRVNAERRPTIRDAFHRSGALALRRPFGRPAKASCEPRGFATPRPTIDAFGAGEPCGTPALDPRSRTSLPARSRFSGSRRRPSTSATVYDARAHPASPFDPSQRPARNGLRALRFH